MKTTFKKALAAVSASAVVATSAVAMFATPASAAGAVFSMGQVEISLADLKAANYQVPVAYSVSNNSGMGKTHLVSTMAKTVCLMQRRIPRVLLQLLH